jgi:signal transduction histidine kinase
MCKQKDPTERADAQHPLNRQTAKELSELHERLGDCEKDIAKRKRRENLLRRRHREMLKQLADLKATQQQLIQDERLNALGQMSSGIFHDFSNWLTPILGASDFLLMNPNMLGDREEPRVLLESVRTAGRDAKNIVNRLREFYRPDENAPMDSVDINSVVEQAIQLTKPKWQSQSHENGKLIEIKTVLKSTPHVKAAESQLREMLTNVILNSVEAMPDGGAITIDTDVKDKWIVLRVTDTGKGMSEEACQRCFEPFFSTKGTNGAGMGLSIAYGVVHKYKGAIKAESRLGKGTTMTIWLPIGRSAVPPS